MLLPKNLVVAISLYVPSGPKNETLRFVSSDKQEEIISLYILCIWYALSGPLLINLKFLIIWDSLSGLNITVLFDYFL